MADNQVVTKQEIEAIRAIEDFDVVMLISEIHDHGWLHGQRLLRDMPKAKPFFQENQ